MSDNNFNEEENIETVNENENYDDDEFEKKYKGPSIIFIVILIILGIIFLYCKVVLPKQLYNKGIKLYTNQQYEKALKIFDLFNMIDPFNEEIIFYQASSLSHLPSTYSTQKALYDISQLDEYDEGERLAENKITEMRKSIEEKVGSNYIENVLYQKQVLRWNLKYQPLTYYISRTNSIPEYYITSLKYSFDEWQRSSNNLVQFKEISEKNNANIVVNFVDEVPDDPNNPREDKINTYNDYRVGSAIPRILEYTLQQMDINIKISHGNSYYNADDISSVMKHEIGHALGLWGHSDDKNDIMYYSADNIDLLNRGKHISQRDINTLKILYYLYPDIINIRLTEEEKEKSIYHYVLTQDVNRNFMLELQKIMDELKKDPNNIAKWVDLAIYYGNQKKYKLSNHILFNTLPLAKFSIQNTHVINYNIAANYYKMRQYTEANKYIKDAESYINDTDTQMLHAFIKYRLNYIDEAQEDLEILQKRHPENIEIALKLADIYRLKKDKDKEKKVIKELIYNNPEAKNERRVYKYRVPKSFYLRLAK